MQQINLAILFGKSIYISFKTLIIISAKKPEKNTSCAEEMTITVYSGHKLNNKIIFLINTPYNI